MGSAAQFKKNYLTVKKVADKSDFGEPLVHPLFITVGSLPKQRQTIGILGAAAIFNRAEP